MSTPTGNSGSPDASTSKRWEGMTAVAAVASAAAAVIAVVVASLTSNATNQSTALQYELSRKGQIADRFSKAVELLTGGDVGQRLGGIYALEQIAAESEEYQDAVKNELAGFARLNSHRQDEDCPPTGLTQSPDLLAAVRILADQTPLVERPTTAQEDATSTPAADTTERRWDNTAETFIDLAGSCLHGASLQQSRLPYVHLNGADIGESAFDYADLRHASFGASGKNIMNNGSDYVDYLRSIQSGSLNISGASFRNANLKYADLSSIWVKRNCNVLQPSTVWFHGARLNGAIVWQSVIPDADFTGAKMDGMQIVASAFVGSKFDSSTRLKNVTVDQWVDFEQADMRGMDLRGITFKNARSGQVWPKINFRDANLYGADLRNVDLSDVDFSGADLREAKFDGIEQLKNSRWDGWTLWPDDVRPTWTPASIPSQLPPRRPTTSPTASAREPSHGEKTPTVPSIPPSAGSPQVVVDNGPGGSVRIEVRPSAPETPNPPPLGRNQPRTANNGDYSSSYSTYYNYFYNGSHYNDSPPPAITQYSNYNSLNYLTNSEALSQRSC